MGHDGGRQGASSREADWDAAALQEWVAHVADAEEVSEGEILDRMLSALWILDEVETLMDESEGPGIPDLDLNGIVQDASPDTDPDTDTDEASASTPPGWGDRDVPDLNPAALVAAVDAIRGNAGASTRGQARDPAQVARLDARLDNVVEELGSLKSRVDLLSGRDGTTGEPGTDPALAATVDTLADRVDEHETRLGSQADALDDQSEHIESHAETLSAFGDTLCSHAERLADAEASVETMDDALDDYEDRIETVESGQSEVASTQDDLEDAYASNFENVDTALRFLVDRTDDVSDTVEQLEASLAAERRERRRRADERRRLAELRHELASHGVTRASCESCRNDVDVSCLLRPRCPHCDRVFDGHRRRGGIMGFLATDELTTTRAGPRMQTPASRDPEPPTNIDAHHPADD